MEYKKNKNVDLSRKSTLFFQLALILVLFLTWQTIEWKTYGNETSDTSILEMDDFDEEEIPITALKQPTPPPPPKDIVKEPNIVDDDKDVVETVIKSTETLPNEIIDVDDIVEVEKEEDIESYSIMAVEEVPVYPGCENLDSNEERKECMSRKVNQFVNRKFDTKIGSELGLTGIHRTYVQFKIEPDGSISVIGARGPHPRLEEEAIRVAKSLPEMQPGRQAGKAVGVLYSLPIIFKVEN
ncbi:energy transducer TonB [Salinimicrobium sp. GXAS 041]|uniref:energy transducer TonB n=1 Tax=Salinimicrobium sp. GXAS 041 TaxID=3400806 RepID=UPI003C709DCC